MQLPPAPTIAIFRAQFGRGYFYVTPTCVQSLYGYGLDEGLAVRAVCDDTSSVGSPQPHRIGLLYSIESRLPEGTVIVEVVVRPGQGRPIVWAVKAPMMKEQRGG